jgi:fumarate hydratase subunit alpha
MLDNFMIDYRQVKKIVSRAVIDASTKLRNDQINAYIEALEREENDNARWVLEKILENARVAERERHYPLCNDTGVPHIYIELGREFPLPPGFFQAIYDGVVKGERDLPTRPMAVIGGPVERLAQLEGLSDDPGQLTPAPFIIENIPSCKAHVTVLMIGGGPELQARTYRVYHHKSGERVLKEAAKWAIEGAAKLGCTPCVPTIGIGRTTSEASALMLKALSHGRFDRQNKWERLVVDMVNTTGVGPLGLGGSVTALGSFIEIGPQRASGARVVCMRLGCCYDPRRAVVEFG